MNLQTAFLKVTYDAPDSVSASDILALSYSLVNTSNIRIKSITLYDPASEDLGTGLLDDTVDAINDSLQAKDDTYKNTIFNLKLALKKIISLDPEKPDYPIKVRKTAKDALSTPK